MVAMHSIQLYEAIRTFDFEQSIKSRDVLVNTSFESYYTRLGRRESGYLVLRR